MMTITNICQTPEENILLKAMIMPDISRSKTTIHSEKIKWDNLIEMAEHHGLTPLLYTHLKNETNLNIPEKALATLADRHQANKLRNRVLSQELYDILELFSENGIQALAYKGSSFKH